jgi:hypothetical protein
MIEALVFLANLVNNDTAIPIRVTRRLEKKFAKFFKKIAQKVAKSKKCQNIYNKAQFERPKHLQQMTFETLKVAQLAKNRRIWSP